MILGSPGLISASLLTGLLRIQFSSGLKTPSVERENQNEPRVGYCINGLARSFVLPMVYKSIRPNLIEAYGGEPVVFASMTTTEKHSAAKTYTGHSQASPNESDVLGSLGEMKQDSFLPAFRQAVKALNPVDIALEPDVTRDELTEIKSHLRCGANHHLSDSLISQLVHSSKCWQMIEKYEVQTQTKFDLLVYLRPDATWYKPVAHYSDLEAWPEGTLVANSGGKDHAVFGNRTAMKHWFNRLQWSQDNQDCSLPIDQLLPVASGLGSHFESIGVPFMWRHIPVIVVRDNRFMNTAIDACKWVKEYFGRSFERCLNSVYTSQGRPIESTSGPWW